MLQIYHVCWSVYNIIFVSFPLSLSILCLFTQCRLWASHYWECSRRRRVKNWRQSYWVGHQWTRTRCNFMHNDHYKLLCSTRTWQVRGGEEGGRVGSYVSACQILTGCQKWLSYHPSIIYLILWTMLMEFSHQSACTCFRRLVVLGGWTLLCKVPTRIS